MNMVKIEKSSQRTTKRFKSRARNLPRIFSSAKIPSLVAHWKPATTESLISLRYWTPFVQSMMTLGPVPSGPKHQILRASVTSWKKTICKLKASPNSCTPTYPIVFLRQVTSADLEVVARVDSAWVDVFGETIWHWNGLHEQTVVLVRWLR